MRVDTRQWPIREKLFTIIVSILKAWKVTMVLIVPYKIMDIQNIVQMIMLDLMPEGKYP